MIKTIGEVLKTARLAKKHSLVTVEAATKIKQEFIQAIENQDWETLPEYPVTMGFVKTVAAFVGVDENKAMATLRRDYPPHVISQNPRPDISNHFSLNPKTAFMIVIGIVGGLLLAYLLYQYVVFTRAPKLEVITPTQNQQITTEELTVVGKTVSDATVMVNNQPAIVDDEGNFTTEIEVSPETKEISFTAKSRAGKETTLVRRISVKLK